MSAIMGSLWIFGKPLPGIPDAAYAVKADPERL